MLIIDANVLIDYANTDPSILSLCVRHLGALHIPTVILDEVQQLTDSDCQRLGLTVIEEPVEVLLAAAAARGAVSFEDHVCLLLAKQNDWTCLTNDKALRRACQIEGVAVMRGLRLMAELVALEKLDPQSAMEVALAIQRSNPRHITPRVIEELRRQIGM